MYLNSVIFYSQLHEPRLIETRVVFEFKASYQAGTGKTWLIETRVVFEYGRCRAYNIA